MVVQNRRMETYKTIMMIIEFEKNSINRVVNQLI